MRVAKYSTITVMMLFSIIVDCALPQVSDGITLMYNSTLEGSELLYSCGDSDFNYNKTAVCQKDGRWSSIYIICGLSEI